MDIKKFAVDLEQQVVIIEYSNGRMDVVPYSHELMHDDLDGGSWLDFLGDNDRILKGRADPYVCQCNAGLMGEEF